MTTRGSQPLGTALKRLVKWTIIEPSRPFTRAALLVALAFFSAARTASKKPSKVETALANMAKDVVIPIEAEKKKNPLDTGDQTLKGARKLYLQSCALCHGSDGHGRTNLGRSMYPPAMDLTSPHVQHWSDPELFWIIQNGVRLTGMPSWKSSVSEADTWKLVRFVHALPELNTRGAGGHKRKGQSLSRS